MVKLLIASAASSQAGPMHFLCIIAIFTAAPLQRASKF